MTVRQPRLGDQDGGTENERPVRLAVTLRSACRPRACRIASAGPTAPPERRPAMTTGCPSAPRTVAPVPGPGRRRGGGRGMRTILLLRRRSTPIPTTPRRSAGSACRGARWADPCTTGRHRRRAGPHNRAWTHCAACRNGMMTVCPVQMTIRVDDDLAAFVVGAARAGEGSRADVINPGAQGRMHRRAAAQTRRSMPPPWILIWTPTPTPPGRPRTSNQVASRHRLMHAILAGAARQGPPGADPHARRVGSVGI